MTHDTGDTSCRCERDELNSRRRFLHKATTITFGAISLTILPLMAGEGADGESPSAGGKGSPGADEPPLFGFLVDTEKCIGAGKCLLACRVENDVPDGYHRTWV